VHPVGSISADTDYIQLRGVLGSIRLAGERRSGKRLTAVLQDPTGTIDLIWFQGAQWIQKMLVDGGHYLVYGRVSNFNGKWQISHPEMDLMQGGGSESRPVLEPVYPSTEKLKSRNLGGRALGKLTRVLLDQLSTDDLAENLPASILTRYRLIARQKAFLQIHFPRNALEFQEAVRRLKFEELFLSQIRICRLKIQRLGNSRGFVFEKVGTLFHGFYSGHLPFTLTGAQKKVLREIRRDTASGHQMNRLIQGDVGSGKTIVALLSMLLAVDNGFQACLMAPTEILARQHMQSITSLLGDLPVPTGLLTGSIKGKARKKILEQVASGETLIIIGTHALVEEGVAFANLGLAIIDEQHRFGVAQRAGLWSKNEIPPHILVMTATPIPRTLAMTMYGDLDVSVIGELPPGRKPVRTLHCREEKRSAVLAFVKEEIDKGRQAYFVYPMIEESEKSDYENLMKGYGVVSSFFQDPGYRISMVHGRQAPEDRRQQMESFVTGNAQIIVATTVIEVGVDVANATVMVIESAERFGLSQLHQLRGRVGRGADSATCILITPLSRGDGRLARIRVMEQTTDGFIIADKDLELRGPGDIEGTRQSGELDFRLADLSKDRPTLEAARQAATELLQADPDLAHPSHAALRRFLEARKSPWSKIS
jgi:ATP-dependent DNA helicase RecG